MELLPIQHRARIAVFVDGDNVSPAHGPSILRAAGRKPSLARVYGSAQSLAGWSDALSFERVLSVSATPSRNATDMTLCVDAMHHCLVERPDRVTIASSDGDFAPLALRLRALGMEVVGLGEEKAPAPFRLACTWFEQLGRQDGDAPLLAAIRAALKGCGAPMTLSALGQALSTVPSGSRTKGPGWLRDLCLAYPDDFALSGEGAGLRVALARRT
jgi:hypothetical protein